MIRIALSIVFLSAITASFGQSLNSPPIRPTSPSQGNLVQGEIEAVGYLSSSLTVKLMSTGGLGESVPVNPDGSFELRNGAPGIHELIVTGGDGKVFYDEHVNITGGGEHLLIRIPDRAARADDPRQGTVSIHQLQHKVPAQAQNQVNKGRSAVAKGKTQEATGYFKEAIRIDPEFADAYNDLGAVYASLGELPEAVEQFRKAIDLVPEHGMALSNLCVVLGKMKQYVEVGPVARSALRADPANAKVHFILAISLIATSGSPAETLEHLQRAAAEIPRAHVIAAQLLMSSGRRKEARAHLEEYLRLAPANDAEWSSVQQWVRQLNEE